MPLARPLKNAFGVFDAGPLVLIDIETDQGITGRSYIFAYARMTLKPLIHLSEGETDEPRNPPSADDEDTFERDPEDEGPEDSDSDDE